MLNVVHTGAFALIGSGSIVFTLLAVVGNALSATCDVTVTNSWQFPWRPSEWSLCDESMQIICALASCSCGVVGSLMVYLEQ